MKGQSRRHMADFLYIGLARLGDATTGVGGQRLQITAGTFRIQGSQRQGRLPRAGYPGNGHKTPQRDVHINVFQIMHPGTSDDDIFRALFTFVFACNRNFLTNTSYISHSINLLTIH